MGHWRLKGPEAGVSAWLAMRDTFLGGAVTWIRRAGFDPELEVGDFAIFELPLRRHFQIAVGIADGLPELALGEFARNDCGAGIATGLPASAGIEAQTALLLVGAVTVDAVGDEQRANALLKMRQVRSICGGERESE